MNFLRAFARQSTTERSQRQRWLLTSNCQAMGLGNCLNLLSDEISVEYYDPANFRKQARSLQQRVTGFDRVLIAPQLEHSLGVDFGACGEIWRVPTIAFNAYHPDICYVEANDKPLKSPLGDYHSLIAYAAFRVGLDLKRTLALYREEIYAALGYLDRWDHARDRLLGTFRDHGFDISQPFIAWTRGEPFMHSPNHPRIHCLRDVACGILARAGLEASYLASLPHDNLANGPIYPVYPEIGSRLGTHGDYLFKPGGTYQFLRHEAYLAACFDLYRSSPGTALNKAFAHRLEKAVEVVEAAQ